MTVDYLPAVKAFCEARLDQIKKSNLAEYPDYPARKEELQMVISLCDGLSAQQAMMQAAESVPAKYHSLVRYCCGETWGAYVDGKCATCGRDAKPAKGQPIEFEPKTSRFEAK